MLTKSAKKLETISGRGTKRTINPSRTPNKRFETGPASAVKKLSRRGMLKFRGFIITGLAQPKAGKPEKIKNKGTTIVPIKSMWARGFNDNLPSSFAVGSPNFKDI